MFQYRFIAEFVSLQLSYSAVYAVWFTVDVMVSILHPLELSPQRKFDVSMQGTFVLLNAVGGVVGRWVGSVVVILFAETKYNAVQIVNHNAIFVTMSNDGLGFAELSVD